MSVRIYTCGLCMHHHGLYLFTMHTKEHGSLLIQSLERPMKWLTMVESLFFQNRCSFQGQYANLQSSHGSKLQEISEGSNASDNKPFYNFLEVKDPELGRDAPGSHHGRHKAGRYGLDLSLKL
ncbi:uncharacterized protein [Arachis hypogaea]|uniref:uncharacterized protein isoform X1 n=2 Tax=Arachis TaxID=3817 RepID=UPI0007AEEBC3|nr:uncharacterized protein LOC112733393 isoform X2 [Arachis hypogaea]QHO02674.1 uncharacterized protein DS421_13g425790 [Arachis hypogaea]